MTREFQRICCKEIKCTSSNLMLSVGISFGNQKIYIMETESSIFDDTMFDSKKYFSKQKEFKKLLFKLLKIEKEEK